jgi:hypothetical protein
MIKTHEQNLIEMAASMAYESGMRILPCYETPLKVITIGHGQDHYRYEPTTDTFYFKGTAIYRSGKWASVVTKRNDPEYAEDLNKMEAAGIWEWNVDYDAWKFLKGIK